MKKNAVKGTVGYLNGKKRLSALYTILLFVVALSLFFAGYAVTGTEQNLLTIFAVLGLLPACKSIITTFMYVKAKGTEGEFVKKHDALLNNCLHSYDLVFTTYERSYNVPYLVIRSGNVCGLSVDTKKDMSPLEKHIETCLAKEKHHANIVIFKKEEEFLHRVEQLSKLEDKEPESDMDIQRILYDITL